LFRHDFLDNPANYCSHPVLCFKDMDRGKLNIFWHLTERDDKAIGGRIADPRRAERLAWARPMLDHVSDPNILHWDYEEGDKTIKTYVWLQDFDLVVILKRMPDMSRRLITSFYVDYSNKRRDLKRKYDQRLP